MSKDNIFKVYDRGIWKKAKKCVVCGKVFTNRAKWNNFEEVKYCSKRCKRNKKRA